MSRVEPEVPSKGDLLHAEFVFDTVRALSVACARFHRASEIVEHEGESGRGLMGALAELATAAEDVETCTRATKAITLAPPPHLDTAVKATRQAVVDGMRGLDGSHRLARKAVRDAVFFGRIHPPPSNGSARDRLVVGAWEAAFAGGVSGVDRREWHRPGSPAADYDGDLKPLTFNAVLDTKVVLDLTDATIAGITGTRSALAVEQSRRRYRRRVAAWKKADPYVPWWEKPEAKAAEVFGLWVWAFAQLPRRREWPEVRWPLSLMAP